MQEQASVESLNIKNEDLEISDIQLGAGKFSTVWEGKYKGKKVAIKKAYKAMLPQNYHEQEKQTLAKLNHKNIIHLYGFSEDKHHVIIVTEYAPGGTLASKLVPSSYPSLSLKMKVKQSSQFDPINFV